MSAPSPMLAAGARELPGQAGWVMQPKWDGFRLLVEVGDHGAVRAFSRNGTNLTDRLGVLLDPLAALPAASVLDGELVALAETDRGVTQDFAAVGRAALHGDSAAARALHYVAFDVLSLNGHDARTLWWRERDELLRDALPETPRIRAIHTQPATASGHDAIIGLGFEGTVLKRERSTYRPGRQSSWRKIKARHRQPATLIGVGVARDGRRYAVCELVDGRRVSATVLAGNAEPGQLRSSTRAATPTAPCAKRAWRPAPMPTGPRPPLRWGRAPPRSRLRSGCPPPRRLPARALRS